jgi:uncharacterized membrane protein (UPF0127 family)
VSNLAVNKRVVRPGPWNALRLGIMCTVAWLLREGEVLASLELAESWRARSRGLLGRDGIDGALLLPHSRSVHTIGMRFPIDVAFCDGQMRVVRLVTMPRHRVSRPVWRARAVVEAEAGAFARWNLCPGDQLEVKG